MASTVIEAFSEFVAQVIDIDTDESKTAKSSRDWLMDRIHSFPDNDASFPKLYSAKDIFFGSFERKTKKRPLDDIDIMVCLDADEATYYESGAIYITSNNENSPLHKLRHDFSSNINSKKVINKFVSALGNVSQYGKAEINRRGEAATLQLTSYNWVFDIVPCFHTKDDANGRSYYIIPDGEGNWKKTDPRIDRARVRRLTDLRGRRMLAVIRLVKFWNCRPTMPTMGSYLLENMILDYYEDNECSNFPDLEFSKVIMYIKDAIYGPVWDPKGIQGNLNNVGVFNMIKISERCASDHKKCNEARQLEVEKDYRKSIAKWREIFGDSFPTYS